VRGMVSPAEFIPLAEDIGAIHDIGDWVYSQTLHQVAKWQKRYGRDFQISVNKSPVQFSRGKHGSSVWMGQLLALGLTGKSIVIEITEGVLMESKADVAAILMQYRDAGVQVAIDDFGTGYSSLSYLKKFDIDYLKIDQSFVRNLAPESADFALCEAIIVMAHKLGLKVVAEGVETPQQRDLWKGVGCDFAQGYLFSRPVTPHAFEEFLEQ
jgi:EAL domain-containing protein (putative c-di-GMP-specific phosphodiesterase class I)